MGALAAASIGRNSWRLTGQASLPSVAAEDFYLVLSFITI
jgi:hypothetical protein